MNIIEIAEARCVEKTEGRNGLADMIDVDSDQINVKINTSRLDNVDNMRMKTIAHMQVATDNESRIKDSNSIEDDKVPCS